MASTFYYKDFVKCQSLSVLAGSGTVAFGEDDAGIDVKFFGDTASAYALWDQSADDLLFAGGAGIDMQDTGQIVFGASHGGVSGINMNSVGQVTGNQASLYGSVIKTNYNTGTVSVTAPALTVKNYTEGGTFTGNIEVSSIIGYLKLKGTLAGGAKSSLMSLHRHSSSTGTIDYGIRVFSADSKLTTLLYASGTMTNFFEAVASGAGGATAGVTDISGDLTADAYLTINIAGTAYKVLAWAA